MIEGDDGTYSIFLNARFTQEQQINSYIHALGHIIRWDFENETLSADLLEYHAHK